MSHLFLITCNFTTVITRIHFAISKAQSYNSNPGLVTLDQYQTNFTGSYLKYNIK